VAPRIETARLILRGYEPGDLDAHVAIHRDAEVMRHLGPLASREDSWRRLLQGPTLWDWLGYGYWGVERRADGAYLGHAGFADFKRDVTPSLHGIPEMGWIFATAAQGQGYAREACEAALAWADRTLHAPETAAIISPRNERSIRLAEKLGYLCAEQGVYKDDPILIARRARQV
jgi:RimJ/RimL family protein N-acetyltransferase